MSVTRIATRYSKALYRLANGIETAKGYLDALETVEALYQNKDAGRVLRSPVMPTDLKFALLQYGLEVGTADESLRSFVKGVVDAGRANYLPEIISSYRTLIKNAQGIVEADLTSAVELPAEDLDAIGQSLGRVLGKRVEVNAAVDPDLLGGFRVTVGNYRLDLSLKSRLDELAHAAVN